ncbi:unnamed protein product [Psylliodes chrysocephalus]|uniref:Ionotropic glutamate receptor C-terminal domain-containing protein n=1 Tax=Psylliodes chrysocephalus TaxID=3402493 RepID=A0A9P0CMF8_9CUCU|nr:unnamed protein product [Psylliodes chrysocephala]
MPLARRRRNFQKHEVVILAVVNSNKSFLINFDDPPPSSLDEPFFLENAPNIMNMIYYLNASHIFRPYKVYGHFNQTTGKFYGMVNDLAQGLGDITGSALFVSEERQRILDYIAIATTWGGKIILKKPSMSYIENIYLMTFTGQVWIASLLVLITFGITLYILLNWEKHNLVNTGKNIKIKYSVSDATLLSFEALCQQGTTIESATISGRILLVFLFTAFMFLYAAYSGYILVLLQSTKPIESIKHLLDSRLECGGINISFIMDWYNVNKDPALRALYHKKLHKNRFLTLENGLARVQEGNFAFHTALSVSYIHILKTFTNYDICKLQELPGYLSINNGMYFGAPKTSQYKEFLKIGIMRTYEVGLAIRNKYKQSRKPKCYNEAGNFQSVGIYDCYTIFKLFCIGSFLSFFVLAIEVVTHKYLQKLKKKYAILTTRHG